MTMRLEGVEELQAALSEVASKATQVAIVRRALTKAAQPMRDKAKQYAPYADGRLEKSIRIGARVKGGSGDIGRAAYARAMASGSSIAEAVAARRTAQREFRAANPAVHLYLGPTTDAWYAHLLEFGTKQRFHKSGKSVGKVSPDPFMRPAFDSEATPTINRLRPLIWAEIERHAARAAKRAAKA